MKYTVTDLEASNKPISFAQDELGMCFLETNLGCYWSFLAHIKPNTHLELLPFPQANAKE